jgi:DNA-damage-inducible protein J
MNQTTIRLEPNLKKDFVSVCDEMGLSISSAITIFAKTVVREGRIPFEVTASKKLNAVTIATIKDIENGIGLNSAKTPEELFAQLEED